MWCVRLTDAQRHALQGLLKAQGELGPSLSAAHEALALARWDDLPDAELPWERVRELAEAQGIGEGDVVWDLASGLPGGVKSSADAAGRRPAPAEGEGDPGR